MSTGADVILHLISRIVSMHSCNHMNGMSLLKSQVMGAAIWENPGMNMQW